MSLFDTIHCKMPLPENVPDCIKQRPCFQTGDLGKAMGEYVITKDGVLQYCVNPVMSDLLRAYGIDKPDPVPLNYKRKRIEMHGTNLRGSGPRNGKYVYYTEGGEPFIKITFVVQIRNGKVSSITEKSRDVKPELDIKNFK